MKLKDLRRMTMNRITTFLRRGKPATKAELFAIMPDFSPIGNGTALAVLGSLLEELADRKFIVMCAAGTHDPEYTTYAIHDRLFDKRGVYIGYDIIDPEWPDTWKRK